MAPKAPEGGAPTNAEGHIGRLRVRLEELPDPVHPRKRRLRHRELCLLNKEVERPKEDVHLGLHWGVQGQQTAEAHACQFEDVVLRR